MNIQLQSNVAKLIVTCFGGDGEWWEKSENFTGTTNQLCTTIRILINESLHNKVTLRTSWSEENEIERVMRMRSRVWCKVRGRELGSEQRTENAAETTRHFCVTLHNTLRCQTNTLLTIHYTDDNLSTHLTITLGNIIPKCLLMFSTSS